MFHIFEMLMLLCFGFSWPISVYKTLKAKNADGKSVTFGIVIICGYIFGIIGKLLQLFDYIGTTAGGNPVLFWITFAVYILNLLVVTFDTCVTAHYKFGKGSKKVEKK